MSNVNTSIGQICLGDIMSIDNTGVFFTVSGYAPMTTEAPTVIKPNDYKNEITSKDANIATVLDRLNGHVFESYDELVTEVNTDEDYIWLQDNIVFIWGSLTSGGLGFANINNTSCRCIMVLGAYDHNDGVALNIVNFEMDYQITVSNLLVQDIDKIASKPVANGTYDNGLMFYQIWEWDSFEAKSKMADYIAFDTGATACVQSYMTATPAYPDLFPDNFYLWQPVAYSDSPDNASAHWADDFTTELPTTEVWGAVPDEYDYYSHRSAQRKIYSYDSLLALYGDAKYDTNLFGGAERNADEYGGKPSSTGGGGGTPNRYTDDCLDEDLPDEDILDCGFVNLYNPSKQDCKDLVKFLYANITTDVVDAIKNMLTNPLDAILCAHMIHFKPSISGMQEIKFCGFGTDCEAYIVSNQYYKSKYAITINEWWNSFFDYERTKMKVYLPYIGVREVNPKHFIGGTMEVLYKWDVVSGMCVAIIESKLPQKTGKTLHSALYKFSGNFALSIPLTSANWSSTFQSLLGLAGSAINPVSAISGIANGLTSPMMNVQHSGDISSNFGYMCSQTPVLIVERPEISKPLNYSYLQGYPCNVTYTLSNYVRTIKPQGGGWYIKAKGEVYTGHIKCTDEERNMIRQALLDGVWVRKESNS